MRRRSAIITQQAFAKVTVAGATLNLSEMRPVAHPDAVLGGELGLMLVIDKFPGWWAPAVASTAFVGPGAPKAR